MRMIFNYTGALGAVKSAQSCGCERMEEAISSLRVRISRLLVPYGPSQRQLLQQLLRRDRHELSEFFQDLRAIPFQLPERGVTDTARRINDKTGRKHDDLPTF